MAKPTKKQKCEITIKNCTVTFIHDGKPSDVEKDIDDVDFCNQVVVKFINGETITLQASDYGVMSIG